MSNFGHLRKVELREGWAHEAFDFTKWLSQPENLELVSDGIDIDLELVQTEYPVGSYRVDIYCKDSSDQSVIIENQLETSNHGHLGQIITYASGVDAKYVIWVLKDIKDEHKTAVKWLNENLTEIYFFVFQIELWQIDDSNYAPRLNIVVEPNEWERSNVQRSHRSITGLGQIRYEYWNQLRETGINDYPNIRFRKPRTQNYYGCFFGPSELRIVWKWQKVNDIEYQSTELWIRSDKPFFNALFELRGEIENKLGYEVDWQLLPERIGSRIIVLKEAELENRNNWSSYHEWFLTRYLEFEKVFIEYDKLLR